MKTGANARRLAALGLGCALLAAACVDRDARTITRAALEDKIRGGWAGKMIGVSYGAPTEFRYNGRINEDEIDWSPERVANALTQDDLYVGMTLAEAMDRLGFEATTAQYGDAFKNSQYDLWHANAGARRLLNLGIEAPWSGYPARNIHANDIDFQIEADFIGLMCPGLPRQSNAFCERVGRVMSHGDGLYGGMFVSGMYAAAYFETDVRRVVEGGLACLPAASAYARVVRDVLEWSAQHPDDWRRVWRLLQDRWDRDDGCPDGALRPFNIDAKINGAYVALGLLYGRGDFGRTIEIATRAGQDSDCNPSTSGGILGVMLGYSGIPDVWKSGIPAVAGETFQFTRSSLDDVCRSTVARALRLVRLAGGSVGRDAVRVPFQPPEPPALEQWEMGVPERRIGVEDAAWRFTGFTDPGHGGPGGPTSRMQANGPGAEALLTFTGAAVAITGDIGVDGGRADVYLDGAKAEPIDAYAGPRTHDNDLWHAYGLAQAPHTLRIVPRGEADPRSTGTRIAVTGAVVYRAR
ncbi:MAG TPA: ADP-ribosylglycohydrolase family protein [Vicinamibacterales bacterium]|nr:ADP-ribosylglycohydrolase family protein [Vicinamibacterales bacterium]HPW21711.1 ADP-ribosylglycohydrolase family protein [Vicinamibacterales bacterium]